MLGGNPLGEMRLWVMTHHRAWAYAPEASCRAGASEKADRRDVAMDRHPAISEHGLIGGLHPATLTWSTVQDQTGGKQDGLSIRATRRPLPAPRAAHSLDRQTGPRRCGVQYLSPAAAWLHLPPVCDPDLRYRLHPRCRRHRLRLVLGDSRLVARHQPLDGQLHPTQPAPRGTVNAGNHGRDLPWHGGRRHSVTRRTTDGGER